MFQHFLDSHHVSGDAVRDYSLAGVLTTSPLWVYYMTDYGTPILTFICVFTGAVVGVRRMWRDIFGKQND